ncbi:SDR family NAD(P)-dependent oxidoreductase [Dysgonomonas capnocytophagoides]|uniref:SDR family NAD(P)-dependent oxidoreductase n=1 Tax=Dysgonomonas capnocytophagoides TaxID=45254 RepID=UPI0029248E8B|nr:SDR family oxidoreductase [Dysgonomonas capnocytophagoides]
MKILEGKTVLITGASRGIGAATAKLLAANGAAVIVNYMRSESQAHSVVNEISKNGGKAIAIQADISDPEQVKKLFSKSLEQFASIDMLVLNAGAGFPVVPFVDYEWEDFQKKLFSEVQSAFYCCKETIPSMQQKKNGDIIIVSSTLSRTPMPGFIAHSTTKSALDAFAKSLALELGPDGIRVNIVAPGLTETDATEQIPDSIKQMLAGQTPLRRNAQPEDIAGAILVLLSDMAKFTTGTYIPVSGGLLML